VLQAISPWQESSRAASARAYPARPPGLRAHEGIETVNTSTGDLSVNAAASVAQSGRRGADIVPTLAVFVLPFGLLKEVSFIGQLYSTELLFVILLPFLWLTGKSPSEKATKQTLMLLGVWLVALMVADIYRGTFIGDYLRGWAKLIFLAINFYVLSRLLTTEQRLVAWYIGWNIAFGIFAYMENDDWPNRWKFGLGPAALQAAAGIFVLLRLHRFRFFPSAMALICLGFAAGSLFLNSRNAFLSFFLSGLLFGVCATERSRRFMVELSGRHAWTVLIGVVAFCYLAGQIYVNGAEAGVFGEEAREKYESQRVESLDPVLGAIVGGRGEFFSSTAAIGDSPIIGYGSWPRSAYYFNIYLEAVRKYGSPEAVKEVDKTIFYGEPLIPVHSLFFGAWVEAGIVGAIVWLVFVRRIFLAMRRALDLQSGIDVIVLILGVSLVWDVFFSPFGTERRLELAFAFLLLGFRVPPPEKRDAEV